MFHLVCILIELFETAKAPSFEEADEILNTVLRFATPINHDFLGISISSYHMFVPMDVRIGDTLGTEIALYFEIIEDILLSFFMLAYGASDKFVAS